MFFSSLKKEEADVPLTRYSQLLYLGYFIADFILLVLSVFLAVKIISRFELVNLIAQKLSFLGHGLAAIISLAVIFFIVLLVLSFTIFLLSFKLIVTIFQKVIGETNKLDIFDLAFERLLSRLKGKELGEGYRKILFWIFHLDSIVSGVNKRTFEVFKDSNYARDERSVFWLEYRIDAAYRDTFKPVGFNYGKDSNYVFRTNQILKDANPASFNILPGYYTKDNKSVYWKNEKIEGCDPGNFKILDAEKNLSCDKAHVFLKAKLIEVADPDTFQAIDKYYFQDKYYLFYETSKMIGVDRNSFQINVYLAKAYSFCELYDISMEQGEPKHRIDAQDFAVDNDSVFFRGKRVGERNELVNGILMREDSY